MVIPIGMVPSILNPMYTIYIYIIYSGYLKISPMISYDTSLTKGMCDPSRPSLATGILGEHHNTELYNIYE